jgi:hypothetical protein
MTTIQQLDIPGSSGYCMPFEPSLGEITMIKSHTTEDPGIELTANHDFMCAVADGIVTASGSSPRHGISITARYGTHTVTYGHLTNTFHAPGAKVRHGDMLGVTGKKVSISVTENGRDIDPATFLAALYKRIRSHGASTGTPAIEHLSTDIPTGFDGHREELERLMLRFYPEYLAALRNGTYRMPAQAEQTLRNIFSYTQSHEYFFDCPSTPSNPMGLGERAMPFAAKVQNLLIEDFLSYMAIEHGIHLSDESDADKKKDLKTLWPQQAPSTR